jgi:hypothetical protein
LAHGACLALASSAMIPVRRQLVRAPCEAPLVCYIIDVRALTRYSRLEKPCRSGCQQHQRQHPEKRANKLATIASYFGVRLSSPGALYGALGAHFRYERHCSQCNILQHGVPTRGELLPSKPTFVSLDLLRDAASRAYLCCVASCMRDGYMYMDMYSGMMWMPNLGRGRVVCRSLSRLSVSTGGTCSVRPSSTRTVSAGGSG